MIHNLDFCHKDDRRLRIVQLDFCHEDDGRLMTEQLEDKDNKFVGYVNHVLLHSDAGVLNKFQLVWTYNCIESHLTSWIKTVVTRNVHELSLDLHIPEEPFPMPISVFSCKSLRSLRLTGLWIRLSVPPVFCLPRLEMLHLYGVTFGSDKDFENILKGCPMLNDMHVDMEGNEEDFRFIISSTCLKRLYLSLGRHMSVELDASSLEHLELYDNGFGNFVEKNLTSLVEGVLWINFTHGDDPPVGMFNSIADTLCALSYAKILILSEDAMMALGCATIKLSTNFKSLVELDTSVFCFHWSSLLNLIQSADNLEILSVYKEEVCPSAGENDEDHSHSSWTAPVEVPRCLSTSLKKVVLNRYFGFEDEREMIRYILNNGSALEVVHIEFDKYMKGSMFEQVEEICQYPRISAICEIKFTGWTSQGKEKVCCTVPPGTFPSISFVAMKSSD